MSAQYFGRLYTPGGRKSVKTGFCILRRKTAIRSSNRRTQSKFLHQSAEANTLTFTIMILIEIENTNTGTKLQVPEQYTYINESFERSVDDFTWDEWTEPVSTTSADIGEYNKPGHCLFGVWEMLCQADPWAQAISAVCEDCGSQENVAIRLVKE